MGKPKSYVVHGHEDTIYTFKKTLYGMKHNPRAWYNKIEAYLISNGFNRSSNKPTLNRKENKHDKILIVSFYVDDIIFIGNLSINTLKTTMKKDLEMIDLGLMRYFLSI